MDCEELLHVLYKTLEDLEDYDDDDIRQIDSDFIYAITTKLDNISYWLDQVTNDKEKSEEEIEYEN